MQQMSTQPEAVQSPTRLRGFIKKVCLPRGFCFVRGDDGREYFLHKSNLAGGLQAMVRHATVEFFAKETNLPGTSPYAVSAKLIALPESPSR